MRMYDLIEKKKYGEELTKEELEYIINGYVDGSIPDYQMSAWLMAVYFKGMTSRELTDMTITMAHSGDMVDLSAIEGIKIDKHSTGGVGDKTTLIITPMVAACGVKVAKMSGRGLGHTGGTVDKLESIEGYQTALDRQRFYEIVNTVGMSVIGQSGNLAPADKKLYALRDVTGTVDSIPLIASSIMSKKLAAGSDSILLDVTTGSGAFIEEFDKSIELAKTMVSIGEGAGRETVALLTNMDEPLGYAIGNTMEVQEAIETMKGNGPADLVEVCVALAGDMLYLAKKGTLEECREMATKTLTDGSAFERFKKMVAAQGGRCDVLEDTSLFGEAPYQMELLAKKSGYVQHMNAKECGIASMLLGAGRETKEDVIDMKAGILLKKKTTDAVKEGEVLAILYSSDENRLQTAADKLEAAYEIGDSKVAPLQMIQGRITKKDI
ncbi:MAG: pyrimidine-nucleoside phosphorylase [Lachnospiraceae bacterium]|nr:pyrimidine-nucleoside phosphorylase [Lachnospiraceae bacterium]